jgi:CheY-like chemotaxis protein
MTTVAVINSNADTVEALRVFLEQRGFDTVSTHIDEIKRGQVDFLEFLRTHDPAALVYDISPPYDNNWTFLQLIRSSEAMRGRAVVITTTHKANLERLVGPTEAMEIVGKPYDLEQIAGAVGRALSRD